MTRGLLAVAVLVAAGSAPLTARAQALGDTGFPAPPGPASPSLLPLSGVSTRVGDLRSYLQDAFGTPLAPAALAGPTWQIHPRIGVSETFTDNASGTGQSKRADAITSLRPGLTVVGDTARLKVNLDYSPNVNLYAINSGQSRVDQNLNGSVLGAIIPGEVYVSAQASVGQYSRFGSTGSTTSTSLARNDQVQTTSFSLTPYLSHNFGGTGTLQAGVSYVYSSTSSPTGFTPVDSGSIFATPLPGNFGNSTLRTTREFANFVTGENFGRFQDSPQIDTYQFSGTGVLQNARRLLADNTLVYGLTHVFSLLGEFGYEQVHYSGQPPVRIDDAVWAFGARVTPDADSKVTIEYRHRDGFNSLFFDGTYQVTARIRIFGNYSEGLSTVGEDLQSSLLLSNLDSTGNPLSRTTGGPLLYSSGFFGFETDLYRTRRGSITAAWLVNRDTVSASIQYERRRLVASASPLTANGSDQGTVGTVNWTHELQPELTSALLIQYGTRTPTGSQSEDLYGASASLSKTFTASLSGAVQYSFNRRTSALQGRSLSENVVVVGLQKQF